MNSLEDRCPFTTVITPVCRCIWSSCSTSGIGTEVMSPASTSRLVALAISRKVSINASRGADSRARVMVRWSASGRPRSPSFMSSKAGTTRLQTCWEISCDARSSKRRGRMLGLGSLSSPRDSSSGIASGAGGFWPRPDFTFASTPSTTATRVRASKGFVIASRAPVCCTNCDRILSDFALMRTTGSAPWAASFRSSRQN